MPDINIIEASCPVCGSNDPRTVEDDVRDVENGVPGNYRISECGSCGLIYLSRRPDDASLPFCYDANYHVRTNRTKNTFSGRLYARRYEMRFRSIMKHFEGPPSSVLELGCGDGQMLSLLERKLPTDCRLVGNDIETESIDLPEGSRIELMSGPAEDLNPGGVFDLILMYDVLEHLPNPVDVLRKVAELLSPTGILIAQVPNWDGVWRKVFPRHWAGLQIPRHMTFPEPRSLARMLSDAGLELKGTQPFFDPGNLSVSVCNWLADRLSLKTPPRKVWFYVPMALASTPFVMIETYLCGRAGEIEVAAARKAG